MTFNYDYHTFYGFKRDTWLRLLNKDLDVVVVKHEYPDRMTEMVDGWKARSLMREPVRVFRGYMSNELMDLFLNGVDALQLEVEKLRTENAELKQKHQKLKELI